MHDSETEIPTTQAEATREAREEIAISHPDTRKVCLVALTTLAAFYTLYVAASIILPLLLAVVITLLLLPGKRLLMERLHFPAALAALLLMLALLAVIAAAVAALSLPATSWLAKLPQTLQTVQQKLGFIGPVLRFVQNAMDHLHAALQGGQGAAQQAAPAAPPGPNLGGIGLSVLEGTRAVMGQLLVLLVTLFFTLAYGDSLLRRVVEVMPTFGEKRRVVEIASEIEHNISMYLLTITMMNLFTGGANFLSMWLQGMPDPLLWGALAFLLNYIPILGPLTGVVIFFLVGLFVKSSFVAALLPPAVYLAVHVLEGESITPMLLARRFTLNPVLVIISLFFWDWMWGVVGAFLAVPLLAITKIVCDHIPALTPLGHILGAPKRHGTPGGCSGGRDTLRRRFPFRPGVGICWRPMQIHASCAARNGDGVLLLGPAGIGKSDLLLRLLAHGFQLVADDQVTIEHGQASPPPALAGLLEVRGLGIVRLDHVAPVRVALAVRLSGPGEPPPDRLPRPARDPVLDLPLVTLDGAAASAAPRVALALDCATGRLTQLAGAFAA